MAAPGTRADGTTLVSFIVARPTQSQFDRLHASLAAQSGWQLVVIDDGSLRLPRDDARTSRFTAARSVPFSTAVNGATTTTSGAFISILSADGIIADSTLHTIEEWLGIEPDAQLLFTDESVVESDGALTVLLKPGPAPERLRCQFFYGDLTLYRRDAFDALGGLRDGVDGAELYDLALRASRTGVVTAHVPRVLFVGDAPHELGAVEPAQLDAVRRVLEEHLAATGGGRVIDVRTNGVHVTVRESTGEPLISIVIPTQARFGAPLKPGGAPHSYLVHAVRSLTEKSTYTNYEVVVVVDTDPDAAVIDEVRRMLGDRMVVVDYDAPFNFAAKANRGVLSALGEYILLLNDDIEVITPDWIESLLALAQRPGAGMAGCMLYYEDDTVQHGGHHYWMGSPTHIGLQIPRGDAGPLHAFEVEREVIGVTAACSLLPRSVYLEVGGMTTLLPGAFNDVDFCLKVVERGYQAYWTPRAELYHFESKTRDARVRAYELETLGRRWRHRLHQPAYWPFPE